MNWETVAIAWLLCGLVVSSRALWVLFRQTRILFDDVERLQNDFIKAGPNANEEEDLGKFEAQSLRRQLDVAEAFRKQLCATLGVGPACGVDDLLDWVRRGHDALVVGAVRSSGIGGEVNGENEEEFAPVPPPRVKKPRKPRAPKNPEAAAAPAEVVAAEPQQTELESAISGVLS